MNKLKLKYLLLSLLALQACQPEASDTGAKQNETPAPSTHKLTSNNDSEALNRAATEIDEQDFIHHVTVLASDEFEGRAPATAGGKKTVEYLETEFKRLGLDPVFNNSYRQAVGLVELNVTNEPALNLKHADGQETVLPYKENSIVFTSQQQAKIDLNDSQLVFVGYGVVAPEYGWDDYAGVDMTGKTAVILVNDPGYRQPEGELFKGLTMTYYGRWTYKFEEAARQGAAGAIVVHETGAAGYPWEVVSGSWSGPQYKLASNKVGSNLKMESWISQTAAET